MTTKTDFTAEEWELVSEGPVTAGMIVSSAQSGGSFRESFALAKAYAEARQEHGQSALLDELVSAKPAFDRHRYHSPQELRELGLQRLHEAAELLDTKAGADEAGAYRNFVVALAQKVAASHKEHGDEVSPAETEALDAIRSSLAA
jgi:hypothetical protein